MKKTAVLLCALIAAISIFSGCGESTPQATISPDISNIEGQVLPGDEKGVQGLITSLDDEEMQVKVDGKKYNFILGRKGKKELKLFNNDPENPRVTKGSFVNVYYEEIEGENWVKSIEIVESN